MSMAVLTCVGFVGRPKAKAPTAEDQAEIACGTICYRESLANGSTSHKES